jgi:glycosyltransferase involved in cell wall biosynthesis
VINILFVLYGGVETNSFFCLARFAQEIHRRGYRCAAVLHRSKIAWSAPYLSVYSPEQVLKNPQVCFENGRRAEVIHAWTPRQNVADFVLRYQKLYPTPLFIYSEDDEEWLAQQFLHLSSKTILKKIVSFFKQQKIPPYLSDPSRFRSFLAAADAAAVITPQLKKDFPTSVAVEILFPGVDLNEWVPQEPSLGLREKYGLDRSEKLIVYCGGLNPFVAPSLRDLCSMVLLLNQRGYRSRLLRSGIGQLSAIDGIQKEELRYVLDLGLLSRAELPPLMSLADVFVQPGRPSPFEAGRLPSKIIEFMAMGVPTLLPNCNIASLIQKDQEALLHETGSPEEMAECCEKIFQSPILQDQLRRGARLFAEQHFDIQKNSDHLEQLYRLAQQQYQIKKSLGEINGEHSPLP